MPAPRLTTGIWLLILAAVVGGLLVWLPPTLVEQYRRAAELSETWAKVYLAAVGLGAALLAIASLVIIFRLWRNTRRKRVEREQRRRNPSELSAAERQSELDANLAASGEFAAGDEVPAEI